MGKAARVTAAAIVGDRRRVNEYFASDGSDIATVEDSFLGRPVEHAAFFGHQDILASMLARGDASPIINATERSFGGYEYVQGIKDRVERRITRACILQLACAGGHDEMFRWLLMHPNYGPMLQARHDQYLVLSIYEAAYAGRTELVIWLWAILEPFLEDGYHDINSYYKLYNNFCPPSSTKTNITKTRASDAPLLQPSNSSSSEAHTQTHSPKSTSPAATVHVKAARTPSSKPSTLARSRLSVSSSSTAPNPLPRISANTSAGGGDTRGGGGHEIALYLLDRVASDTALPLRETISSINRFVKVVT